MSSLQVRADVQHFQIEYTSWFQLAAQRESVQAGGQTSDYMLVSSDSLERGQVKI
jgi:hypothetical protein